jgi:hypothetical protein
MIVEDVELRWVPAMRPQDPQFEEPVNGQRLILQMRKKVKTQQVNLPAGMYAGPLPAGVPEWTEWQDVPLVKE